MFEKLDQLEARYHELGEKLSDPELVQNQPVYVKTLKEHGRLSRIVNLYTDYRDNKEELDDARSLVEESSDPEMIELAEAEVAELEGKVKELEEELKSELIMSEEEENPDKLIMEIRAGTGGEEAALFVADLFSMYSRYAERKGWKVEVMEASSSSHDGYKEVIFAIKGKNCYRLLQHESGGHRVQRVPETESQGRIHTSAVTVAVLPEVEDIEVDIKPNDVKMETFRASGPGGQHVNKTSSAVRLTHTPTGIVASCQDEKSQHKNRVKAERILRSRIYQKLKEERDAERGAMRQAQIGSGDRSERIRTYNFPQSRITDHRINFSYYNFEDFLKGEIEIMLKKLQEHFNMKKLDRILSAHASGESEE